MYNILLKIAFFIGDASYTGTKPQGVEQVAGELKGTFYQALAIILPVILSMVTLVGVVYCIVLGVNYAKQEKTDAREEAKKRLVGAIVGFGIAIVGAAILWALYGLNAFDGIFQAS